MSYRLTREERMYLSFMFDVLNRLIATAPHYAADETSVIARSVIDAWGMETGQQDMAALADVHAQAMCAYRCYVLGPQATLLGELHAEARERWEDETARALYEAVFFFHLMSLALLLRGTIGAPDVRGLYDAFLPTVDDRASFLRACAASCQALGVSVPEAAAVLRGFLDPMQRPRDAQKLAIITCVNDEAMYAEARARLAAMQLPDGISLDFVPVRGAPSMCAGYNAGMVATDATYKLYLHQDMMLERPDIMRTILPFLAAHPDIGLVGIAGSQDWQKEGVWWDAKRPYANIWYTEEDSPAPKRIDVGEMTEPWAPVAMLDGVFRLTQTDVMWREDLFRGWHFYDISACAEYRRRGIGVALLRQDAPWFTHRTGNKSVDMVYMYWQRVFLKAYKGDLIKWRIAR